MPRTDDPQALHRQAWDLIPWAVNGRASEDERRLLEVHLRGCRDCREEYEFQRRLCAALSRERDEATPDPQPALRRLRARIDGEGEILGAIPPRGSLRRATRTYARGLLLTVIVEAAVIAGLSVALWLRAAPTPAAYRTLTQASPPAEVAKVRAVFAPDLRLDALQRLLARAGLQIVSGPSEAGVYALAPLPGAAPAAAETLAARLRADPAVRFAEPIVAAR
ncbi:MAG: zf-HC2 domain-containing protein [Sinobacteraceae bacterium]|nr:zf-HC2 domain-containing protein [Nevskiaceae bacterium]